MRPTITFLLIFYSFFLIGQESNNGNKVDSKTHQLGSGYEYLNNGKLDTLKKMKSFFEKDSLIERLVISNSIELTEALKRNKVFLNKKGNSNASPNKYLRYNYTKLKKVNDLLSNQKTDTINFSKLNLHKIWGEDKKGNVHFTSYYIPIIQVSKERDSIYKYPIYKKPSSSYYQGLSRKQIDQKQLLKGKKLEIAYAKNYFDVYSMQVQGSGYVQFQDSTTKLFSYGGKNNKAYTSIGKCLIDAGHIKREKISMQSIRAWFKTNPDSLSILMKNDSYVFFKESHKKPTGAAGVPLTDFVSIAADFKYLPKGAILLGEVPVLDSAGNFVKHEYRILIVHDTGGAIKGAGHIDLFAGSGDKAGAYAGRMKHYGRLWLVLP